jgi:hypothetical protein
MRRKAEGKESGARRHRRPAAVCEDPQKGRLIPATSGHSQAPGRALRGEIAFLSEEAHRLVPMGSVSLIA